MTKANIIEEYNKLTPVLENLLNQYFNLTGKICPGWEHIKPDNMDSSYMRYSKEELELIYSSRQRSISLVKDFVFIFNKKQEMLQTTEGAEFIKSLEKKKEDTQQEIDDLEISFQDQFNRLLKNYIGNWEVNAKYFIAEGFYHKSFEIKHNDIKGCSLHVYISTNSKNEWVIGVNSSVRGCNDIRVKDSQYYQFLAYTTFIQYWEHFDKWLNEGYKELRHKEYDLRTQLQNVENDLLDPYSAWMKTQVTKS